MIDQFTALGKTNFLGKDGFNWWIGQIAPPESWRPINAYLSQKADHKHNRVKVRIIGYHPFDCEGVVLPDDDLPWAEVMIPTHSGSGQASLSETMILTGGETCIGFFLDGEDAQQPVIMGLLPKFNRVEESYNNVESRQIKSSCFKPFEADLAGSAHAIDSNSRLQDGTRIAVVPKNLENSLASTVAEGKNTKKNTPWTPCNDSVIGKSTQAITDFITILQGLENVGSSWIDPLTNSVVNIQAELAFVTGQMSGIMKGTINSIKTNLLKNLNKKFKKLLGPLKAGAKGIDSFFEAKKLKKGFNGVMGLIYCAFENVLGKISGFISNMFQNLIGNVVNGALCAIEQFTAGIFAKVFDSLEGALGTVMSGLNWLVGGLGSVTNVLRSVSGLAKKIFDFIGCNAEKCAKPTDWASNIGQSLKPPEDYGKFMDKVGTLGGLKDTLANAGTGIDNRISKIFGNDKESKVSEGTEPGSIERAIDQISLFGNGNNQFDVCNNKNNNPTSQQDVVPVKPGYIYPKCIPPEVQVIGSGTGAELFLVVGNDRRIFSVEVINGGSGYNDTDTNITIIDNTGNGSGADVRAIVEDGVIKEAVILSSGSGYCLNASLTPTSDPDSTTNVGIGTNVVGIVKDVYIVTPGIKYDPEDTIIFEGIDDGTNIPITTTPSGSIAVVDFPNNINTEFTTIPILTVNSKTGVGANIIPIMSYKPLFTTDTGADERRTKPLIGIPSVIDCIGDNKEVVGYVNGVAYSGPYHVMSNGLKMTGATHSETDFIIYDTMEESLGQRATVSQVINVGVTTSSTTTVAETEVETTPTIVTTTPTTTSTPTMDTTPTDTSSETSTPPSTPNDGGGYGGY
jgi:hypothetical protein